MSELPVWAEYADMRDRIAELEARELGYIQSLRELEDENQRLREALQEAAESVDEYAHYAGEYLRNKHRIDDDIAEWRKLAEGEE